MWVAVYNLQYYRKKMKWAYVVVKIFICGCNCLVNSLFFNIFLYLRVIMLKYSLK